MVLQFVADIMLGKLAKWLRVMGYDTIYRHFYQEDVLDRLLEERRTLLTRKRSTTLRYSQAFFIQKDRVGEQLSEMKYAGLLRLDKSYRFSRCLVCNALLMDVEMAQYMSGS